MPPVAVTRGTQSLGKENANRAGASFLEGMPMLPAGNDGSSSNDGMIGIPDQQQAVQDYVPLLSTAASPTPGHFRHPPPDTRRIRGGFEPGERPAPETGDDGSQGWISTTTSEADGGDSATCGRRRQRPIQNVAILRPGQPRMAGRQRPWWGVEATATASALVAPATVWDVWRLETSAPKDVDDDVEGCMDGNV